MSSREASSSVRRRDWNEMQILFFPAAGDQRYLTAFCKLFVILPCFMLNILLSFYLGWRGGANIEWHDDREKTLLKPLLLVS